MPIVLRAISFAAERHLGQFARRQDAVLRAPGARHDDVLREFGEGDPETLAAAALHDTIEDTATDFDDLAREFGATVAQYVGFLTKDKRLPSSSGRRATSRARARAQGREARQDRGHARQPARRPGGRNVKKTIEKAERLFLLYAKDAGGAPRLDSSAQSVEAVAPLSADRHVRVAPTQATMVSRSS